MNIIAVIDRLRDFTEHIGVGAVTPSPINYLEMPEESESGLQVEMRLDLGVYEVNEQTNVAQQLLPGIPCLSLSEAGLSNENSIVDIEQLAEGPEASALVQVLHSEGDESEEELDQGSDSSYEPSEE